MAQYGKPIMDTSKMSAAQQRRRRREREGVSVDPMCVDLAHHFLADFRDRPIEVIEVAEKALARAIQIRVEEFLADTFEDTTHDPR